MYSKQDQRMEKRGHEIMIQKTRSIHERKLWAEMVKKIAVKQWVVNELVIKYTHVLAT